MTNTANTLEQIPPETLRQVFALMQGNRNIDEWMKLYRERPEWINLNLVEGIALALAGKDREIAKRDAYIEKLEAGLAKESRRKDFVHEMFCLISDRMQSRMLEAEFKVDDATLFKQWSEWYPKNAELFDGDDGDMICTGRMLKAFIDEHGYELAQRTLQPDTNKQQP